MKHLRLLAGFLRGTNGNRGALNVRNSRHLGSGYGRGSRGYDTYRGSFGGSVKIKLLLLLVLCSAAPANAGVTDVLRPWLAGLGRAYVCAAGTLFSYQGHLETRRVAYTDPVTKFAVLRSLKRTFPHLARYGEYFQSLNDLGKSFDAFSIGRSSPMGPSAVLRISDAWGTHPIRYSAHFYPGDGITPHTTWGLALFVDWAAKKAGLSKMEYSTNRTGEGKYHPHGLGIEFETTDFEKIMALFQTMDSLIFPEDSKKHPNSFRWSDTFRYAKATDPENQILRINATRDNKQTDADGEFIAVRLNPGEDLSRLKDIFIHLHHVAWPGAPGLSKQDENFEVESVTDAVIEAKSSRDGTRYQIAYQVALSPEGNTYTIRLPKDAPAQR